MRFLVRLSVFFCFLWATLYGSYHGLVQHEDVRFVACSDGAKVTQLHADLITSLCDKYTRPFTALSLIDGQDVGYMPCIADKYDVSLVMLQVKQGEGEVDEQFIAQCCAHCRGDNLIVLQPVVTEEKLRRFSQCEHFDVVCMLGRHSWYKNSWPSYFFSVLNMGDYIFVELFLDSPVYSDMRQRAYKEGGVIVGSTIDERGFVISSIFFFERHKNYLERVQWKRDTLLEKGDYSITSTFCTKELYKKKLDIHSKWCKGINLRTYVGMSGVFPFHDDITATIESLYRAGIKHNDFNPCNIIIQGKELQLIDFNDPRRKVDPKKGFNRCMNLFKKKSS